MFIDARKLDATKIEDGITIIGAGAAGITLALELEARGIPTTIIESGGFKRETENQDLARGDISGHIYYALDHSRLRYYGGSTNHWAGLCRPMEAHDLAERPWVANSGWPFGLEELAPYYERTLPYLGMRPFTGPDAKVVTFPKKKHAEFEFDNEQFAPKLRIAKEFRERIDRSKLIKVYLYANVVDFISEDDRLKQVTARTHPEFGDKSFQFHAKLFVLAAGGIENPRLLLLTRKGRRHALGDRHEQVGRYFMEHLHAIGGILAVQSEDFPFRPYERLDYHKGFLRLNYRIQREEEILNCRMVLEESQDIDAGPLSASVFDVAGRLDGNEDSARLMHVKFIAEQAPTRESYVGLSEKTDLFGLPRVNLHWHISEIDKRTIDRNLFYLARAIGREGSGRMQLRAGSQSEWKYNFLAGGNHHMGTTRMSKNARDGVVNPDGRLFDVPNFYVAGSSLFPNTGHANPTFTIVALAIRLADHLARSNRGVALKAAHPGRSGRI